MYRIVECSARALAKIAQPGLRGDAALEVNVRAKYPFERLDVGQSFAVGMTESEQSLRVLANNYGKKLSRKFAVLSHKEIQQYEVARIA